MSFFAKLVKVDLEALGADPTPIQGRLYLHTTEGAKWYDGGFWRIAVDTNSLQNVSNKTLVETTISDFLDFVEVAAPANPVAGQQRVYVKSDGNIYKRNNAGVETQVGSGGAPATGYIPLGSVIATLPHLVANGAYVCSATTTPDVNGFVLCQGQTLVAGPMSGAVVPNINNGVFLRGAATSGTSFSGASSVTLASGNIPQVSTSYTPTGTVSVSLSGSAPSLTGTTTLANPFHVHNLGGRVGAGTANGNTNYLGTVASSPDYYASTGGPYTVIGASSSAANYSFNHNIPLSGVTATGATSTVGITGGSWSVGSSSFSGNAATITVGSGAPSSFNVLPTYITSVYVMRAS